MKETQFTERIIAMMLTDHNIEHATQLLVFTLAQHKRFSLEQYTLWSGKLHRETVKTCQLAPAIRRPVITCSVFSSLGLRWLTISTPVGTLPIPATPLEECKAGRCSQMTITPEKAIVSGFGASGTFRRWTFEFNELEVAEFKTSPLMPALPRQIDERGCLVL
jgi:hypothetical protein